MVKVRVDVTEHDIGIGDGGVGAAEIVRCRPRHGAGALGPDLQAVAHGGVQPGDRAAAGPDGTRLQDGHIHPPAVDEGMVLVEPAAAGHHQAEVEAGAAHVRDDDIIIAERLADVGPADESRHRSAIKGLDGRGAEDLRHAAAVVHHHDDLVVAGVAQLIAGAGDLLPHGVMQVGVQDGGDGAGILVLLGGDLRGKHHRHGPQVKVRVFPADNLGEASFVGGVGVGKEQGDDEAPRSLVHQGLELVQEVFLVQGPDDFPARVDPFLDADGHFTGDDGLRLDDAGQVPDFPEGELVRP